MEKLTNRILLIDDNQDNLDLLADLIQHAFPGYNTITASSGLKGLELAASANPDVILLDVVMPGMNGFEVCQKLKANPQTRFIPVVFLTAIKGDREAHIQALESGAEAFLSRPVDESELIAQIRAMQKIKQAAALLQDEKENLTSLVAMQTQALQQTHTATLNLLEDLHAENEARKKNEAALQESEQRFRTLYEKAPVAIFISRNGVILYANQKLLEIHGSPGEEALAGHPVVQFIAPTSRADSLERTRRRALGLPTPEEYETVALHADGSQFPVLVRVASVQLPDGQANLAFITDITERLQAQKLLQESEERYKLMFESAPLAINITRGSEITYANPSYLKMFGFSSLEDLRGLAPLELFTPAWRPVILENIQRRAKGLPVTDFYEAECFHKDGTRFPVQMYFTRTTFADGPGTVGFILDITERKQAQALQQTIYQIAAAAETTHSLEELYPKIHQSISSIMPAENFYIALYDEAKNLLHFPYFKNPKDESFVGGVQPGKGTTAYVLRTGKSLLCTRERHAELERQGEVVLLGVPSAIWLGVPLIVEGKTIGAMVVQHYSDPQAYGEREQHILEFVSAQVAIAIDRKQADDQIRQLNASLEQRVNERTRELREAQEQLVRHEKLATLGQLAGGVGHELRNPLGVINSAVYYLKLVQPDADEKIKKYHLMIEQEVNTASRIINDLLDFGRIVSPDRQPVSVPELMQHVLSRFPAPASVRVKLNLPARLPKVFVDPFHLEQVLGNLTTNACQAMKDCKDGGKLTISASLKKDQVAIAVKDTGTGIPPENIQKLFEPLFTTKLRGIGLGLAVSKKLAEANGGSITVQSEPGRGSTFTLHLPVFVAEHAA